MTDKITIKVGNISDINSATISRSLKKSEIQYLDTSNITKNRVNTLQLINGAKDEIPSRAQRRVKDNTIVYSTVRPNLEHHGILNDPPENLIVSTGFATIDVNTVDKIDPLFLYYYLSRVEIVEHLQNVGTSRVSSYPAISPSDLKSLELKVPSDINVQKKIAYSIKLIDDTIIAHLSIIDLIESYLSKLYTLWFVQFEFPHDSKPYKKNAGRMTFSATLDRQIPSNWEVVSLRHLVDISGKNINPANYPDKEFCYYDIPTYDMDKSYSYTKGKDIGSSKLSVSNMAILASKLNPKFKRVIYSANKENMVASTEFVQLTATSEEMKNFLYFAVNNKYFREFCVQAATGTSSSHSRVNPGVMLSYKIPLDISVASKFGSLAKPLMKSFDNSREIIKQLQILRSQYYPLLLNGQINLENKT